MTLEQLRIFVAVAERLHMTQAAAFLNLTQSAVSSAISTLEDRCATPLFDRIGRRIELTEAGRVLLVEARGVLARAAAAEQALAELNGLQRGHLTIWASQTLSSYWIAPRLVAFHERYPGVEIDLLVGNTTQAARAVTEGEADLGFIEGMLDAAHLTLTEIAQDQLVLLLPPGHDWADGRPIRRDDLLQAAWIMRERGSGTRAVFEEYMAGQGLNASALKVALTLQSNEAVRGAVEAGAGPAVLSELVVASDIAAGRLVRGQLDLPHRPFFVVRHAERHMSRAAATLLAMILDGTSA